MEKLIKFFPLFPRNSRKRKNPPPPNSQSRIKFHEKNPQNFMKKFGFSWILMEFWPPWGWGFLHGIRAEKWGMGIPNGGKDLIKSWNLNDIISYFSSFFSILGVSWDRYSTFLEFPRKNPKPGTSEAQEFPKKNFKFKKKIQGFKFL